MQNGPCYHFDPIVPGAFPVAVDVIGNQFSIPANSGRGIRREENASPVDTSSDISKWSSQADEKQRLYASTLRVDEPRNEREKCKAKRLAVGLCDRVGKSLAYMGSCFGPSTTGKAKHESCEKRYCKRRNSSEVSIPSTIDVEDLCSVVNEDDNEDEADENTDHDEEWWKLHIEYQMKHRPYGIDEEMERNFSSEESETSFDEEGSSEEEEEDQNRHQAVVEEFRRAESERGRPRQRSELGTWRGRERYSISPRRAFSEGWIAC